MFLPSAREHLDRQAVVKLINSTDQSAKFQSTEDDTQGVFTNVAYGRYEAEVSAVGYLSERKELQVINSMQPVQIDVVLQRDSSAISLDLADAMMRPKARKEVKRAVSLLKSNRLDGARQQLEQAYKLSPSTPELNFLLGYLFFQKKDFTQAAHYLGMAATLNPNDGQTLTLLGRSDLERQDYPAARSALEQAIAVEAANWLPHGLLAEAYLHQKEYGRARDEAQVAIAKGQIVGKTVASWAQLVLGQALIGLGKDEEAIEVLNSFLKESPRSPMAPDVRTLLAEIHSRGSSATSIVEAPETHDSLSGVDPLGAMASPKLSVKPWQPPGVDEIKPLIAAGVECPTSKVIEESGKRVEELVEDVARFAAVEDLFHQALDNFGIPVRTETRKYNYVASISELQPGSISVDEFRAERLTLNGYPDRIASTGFAALALVFHPHMRENFSIECEGLGDWHSQATWLVHFRQREDRPSRMQSYNVGGQTHEVDLKGRAWITADKFQIVRIEADMVRAMPEIQLVSEHQAVEYGPVPFPKKNTTLWLPKIAEIYFDFRKHRYYRRHSFDHYMLYSVDSEEKRKEPVAIPQSDKKS
ncbi:MAG TPA: tetratricopeptide repeat protein [Candidatus Sulfotelmatobacter sp.]|nr:tetratricopeptide repeat protein [Candidatus Sulfotelmatobacter sp.]